MINTTIVPGRISTGRPVIQSAPIHQRLLSYVDRTRASQLQPHKRGTLIGQSSDPTKVLVAGTGETAADGHKYPVLVPYFTPTVLDALNNPMPGGPGNGDDLFVVNLSPGNPVVLGQRLSTTPPLPFVSGVTPGSGLQSAAYGDPNVLQPTLSVKTKTTAPAATAGGLHVDSTGLGISLATSSPLVTGSGLDVGIVTNSPLTKSSSGLDVGVTGPITKSGSGIGLNTGTGLAVSGGILNVALTAGTGISISGSTISVSLTAGTGISISGGTISANLVAGSGISISGATISNAHVAGTGITIVSNAIAVSLTAGTGISVSGATITWNPTAGVGIGISGATISVSLATGSALSTTSGLHVLVDGTTIEINGSNQLALVSASPAFGSVGAASVADQSGRSYVDAATPVADRWQSNHYVSIVLGGTTYYLPLFDFHG